jgi:hypothetical protein
VTAGILQQATELVGVDEGAVLVTVVDETTVWETTTGLSVDVLALLKL